MTTKKELINQIRKSGFDIQALSESINNQEIELILLIAKSDGLINFRRNINKEDDNYNQTISFIDELGFSVILEEESEFFKRFILNLNDLLNYIIEMENKVELIKQKIITN